MEREALSDEELVLETKGERPVPVSISSSAVQDSEGRRVGTAVVARDIRDRKEREEQLRHRALHDPLTGLPNRALFEDRLEQLLRMRERGEHVETALREGDTAARLGGDEFAVALHELSPSAPEEEARRVGQRLAEAVGAPLAVDGREISLSCSVGVATCDGGGEG